MSLSDAQRGMLNTVLGLTRDEELDCDAFLELLPAYVEGGVRDEQLRALIDHHRAICPECEQERLLLARARARRSRLMS